MKIEEKYIKSFDGELLYAKEYISNNPKATIILTHDLKEHCGLYENFGKSFQENFNVFTYDLRAHKSSAKEPFGNYSGDFFNDCFRDLIFINSYLQKKYNLPLINIAVGASGAMLIRCNEFFKNIKINVLVGLPFDNLNLSNMFFRTTTKFKIMFLNKNSEAKQTNKLIDYYLSNKFEDGNFQSSNKEYINKIKNDKFCNFNLSANILNSLFRGNFNTFFKKNLEKLNKESQLLFVNGEFDRVTNFNKNTKHLIEKLNKLNYKNIHCWTLKNMRHNIFNETNSDIIVDDLSKFFLENLS